MNVDRIKDKPGILQTNIKLYTLNNSSSRDPYPIFENPSTALAEMSWNTSNKQPINFINTEDKLHSTQELFLNTGSILGDLFRNSDFNIHNSKPELSLEDLNPIKLNGKNIQSCDSISRFYEPYSEKHLDIPFPIPFCFLNESLESLAVEREIITNLIVNIEQNEPILTKDERLVFTTQTDIGSRSQFKNSMPVEKHTNCNATQPTRITEEKLQKKPRKNSNMKKSLATQFQFHHFHESTPLIQNSPSPSPTSITDSKNIFLHYQDKHNLQTQQTGNAGTLSKWKYK